MLSYDDALARVLAQTHVLEPYLAALEEALGSVLANDLIAPLDLPSFDNSQMDGFAVRAADLAHASRESVVWLPVAGVSAAGNPMLHKIADRSISRVYTGAMMPPGLDSVVPIEDVVLRADDDLIGFSSPSAAGGFVRRRGEDLQNGSLALEQGRSLWARELAAAASMGFSNLPVIRSPKVLLVSVGDELETVSSSTHALDPGRIYESNSIMLQSALRLAGVSQISRRVAKDTEADLDQVLEEFFGNHTPAGDRPDVVISSGGVSVGDFDFVKDVFGRRGTIDFWKTAIRPGKPFAFGLLDKALFFGLPGNPASAFVTFELFVRPALRTMQGHSRPMRPMIDATLLEPSEHEPGRRSFQRASTRYQDQKYVTRPLLGQGSHMMRSLADANSLIVLSEDQSAFPSGSMVKVMLLDNCQ